MTCMLAFMGFEHGECPRDGKRVLQLVIEERSVSAASTLQMTPIAPSAIMKVSQNSLCAGENIPRGGDAVAVNR